MWISKINVAYFHSEMYCWHSFKEIFLVHLRSMFENGRLYTGPCQSCQQYIYRMFELLWWKVWKDWWKTHCLLGPQVEVVRIVIDVGVARVKSLVLLLLCHLLNRKKPVFPHLYSLGHIAHTGIFWKRKFNCYHVCRVRWLGTLLCWKHSYQVGYHGPGRSISRIVVIFVNISRISW